MKLAAKNVKLTAKELGLTVRTVRLTVTAWDGNHIRYMDSRLAAGLYWKALTMVYSDKLLFM